MKPRRPVECFICELVFRLNSHYAPDRLEYTSIQSWEDSSEGRWMARRLCHQLQALKESRKCKRNGLAHGP